MAQDTWSHDGGTEVEVSGLIEQICATSDIEGLTILGGEPFLQAEALGLLAESAKKNNLSVVTFTGFTLQELEDDTSQATRRLLNATDLLIDGPFDESQYDLSRPWVGSSNQQYNFLSSRYSFDDIGRIGNKIEIRISKQGTILANGMGQFGKLREAVVGD